MLFFKKNKFLSICIDIALICAMPFFFVIIKNGMSDVYGANAIKNRQRGIFLLSKNIANEPKALNIGTNIANIKNEIDFIRNESLDNDIYVSEVIEKKKDILFVITGLGFNVGLTKKVIEHLPPEVVLGFAVINQQHIELLQNHNVQNKILMYVPINQENKFNINGISSQLTMKENLYRLSDSLSSFVRVDGIYVDLYDLIKSGSEVASIVLRMAKEHNFSILNLNSSIGESVISKFKNSSLKLINSSYFVGYSNNDLMHFIDKLERFDGSDGISVFSITANDKNIDYLINWFTNLDKKEIILSELSDVN